MIWEMEKKGKFPGVTIQNAVSSFCRQLIPFCFHLSSFIYRWFFRNINPRNPEKLPLLFAYKTIQKVLTKSFGNPDALMRENQNEQKLLRVRSSSSKRSILYFSETSSRCNRHGRTAIPPRSTSASASTSASSCHILGPAAPSPHPLFTQFGT